MLSLVVIVVAMGVVYYLGYRRGFGDGEKVTKRIFRATDLQDK